jgi:uncharacterized protein YutE (UPF0331/DUF86 family)
MVDRALVAARIASVRDAVARVRAVLASNANAFLADREAREVTALNVFVALSELSVAGEALAGRRGAGRAGDYAEVFRRLGERGVVPADLPPACRPRPGSAI